MLCFPRKMSFAIVNILSCSIISWMFMGTWTSCLFDAFILSIVIPHPWVRMSCSVRWKFFCSSMWIGSVSAKEKGEWLLGVLLLDQRSIP